MKIFFIIKLKMEPKEDIKTIVQFIPVKDMNARLGKIFNSIKLEYADVTTNLSDFNTISFNIDLEENCIYYNEIFDFYLEEISLFPELSFEYPIYKNKINNIYIDNYDKNNINSINDSFNNNETVHISLEIIFQSIKNDLLPKKIVYDNKELTCFDTFQNNLRKRIGLININPYKLGFINEILEKYPDFKFVDSTPYQILVRIPNEGNIEYSIANLEFSINRLKHKSNHIVIDKKNSLNALANFKENLFTFIENSENENEINLYEINDLNVKSKSLNNIYSYYKNILCYNDFNSIDLELFNLIFYYKEFSEIIKIIEDKNKKGSLMAKLAGLTDFNKLYEKYISQIKELDINIKDKLMIMKAYNKKFIKSFTSGYEINYIDIVNLNEDNKSNPYYKSINFIKNIMLNLKEESRLFEIFLYFDSHVKENLLISYEESTPKVNNDNINKEKKLHPTEYGLNMSNIDEVRDHLLKLIPKYMIRIDSGMKSNENYDSISKIMFINEMKLFKIKSVTLNKIFKKDKKNDRYVLPIIIEILHQIYSHCKKRFIDNNEKSPQEYRDSKHNYKRIKIKKKIKPFQIIDYPESGVVLENYISEKRNVLRWLRKIHGNNEEKQIMNISLWVERDFKKLEDIVENYINFDKTDNHEESIYETFINSNDEDFIDSDSETCGFHKDEYNIFD